MNLCIVPFSRCAACNSFKRKGLSDSEFNGNSLVTTYCTLGFCGTGYTVRSRERIVRVCLTWNSDYLLRCNNITFVLELVCYGCNVIKHRKSFCRVEVSSFNECNGVTCVNSTPVVNNHLLATAKIYVFVGVAFEVYTHTAFAH